MPHLPVKLLIGGVAIVAAVAFLAIAGAREGWVYYLAVDDFVAGEDYHAQRVRLHGNVSEDGLEADSGLLFARFSLEGERSRVPVEYHGVIPDMFRPGSEVVVEGRLDENGRFQADLLLTKCASKYESDEEPAQPPDHPATGTAE